MKQKSKLSIDRYCKCRFEWTFCFWGRDQNGICPCEWSMYVKCWTINL